jgi:hypothetical protein
MPATELRQTTERPHVRAIVKKDAAKKFTASSPEDDEAVAVSKIKGRMFAVSWFSGSIIDPGNLHLIQAFVQFDISAPRIGDERQSDTQVRPLGVGHVEFLSVGLGFLAKCLQAHNLKSDVI